MQRYDDNYGCLEESEDGALVLYEDIQAEIARLQSELAAEKALADRLYRATFVKDSRAAREAYRKARGL